MMDNAVVGPLIKCMDDPKRAAIMGGIMAVYRPYSAGRPATRAKETPWGRTMNAPVRPAARSARRVERLISPSHCRKGNNLTRRGIFRIGRGVGDEIFNISTPVI